MSVKRRIGLVGFGKLGQFIADAVVNDATIRENYELAFVWNRNAAAMDGAVPSELQLADLGDFASRSPDVIVEVAHPAISRDYGTKFLECCDYMAGSPTAFATLEIEQSLRAAAALPNGHGLYIPRGALPGLEEVLRMVKSGKLAAASIVMHKHPSSLKFGGVLTPPLEETTEQRVIYKGSLRKLCALAPNNVNTMAVLAMASELGFDAVQASLVANPVLEHHITEVKLLGPDDGGPRYCLTLNRESPAGAGAVTSTATLTSFLTSALGSQGRGDGVYFV